MLFVNGGGELLLQLRDDKPEIRFPAHWGVIGGQVEAGESFEEALARETIEEIELTVNDYEYWDTHESPGYSVAMFAARLDRPAEALSLHEGQRVQWFSPQSAMMQPLVPWLAEVLPRFVRSEVYGRLCPEAPAPGNDEAASVIFVNRDGELLLRLRGSQAGLPFPGMWDLIGGAMEEGETAEDAAVRETLEEVGLVLEHYLYWGEIRGVVLIHVFMAPLDLPAEAIALQEGERIEWFEPESALKLPLVPYMERLIPQFVSTPPYRDLYSKQAT
jgi:8-oxo-dGTP diphosphatase